MEVTVEKEKGFKKTEVGWIPEDWELQSLGELLLSPPDYGINAPAIEYSSLFPTYLRITDISNDGYFLNSGKKSVKNINSGSYYLAPGEIVLARTGASTGKSYHYTEDDGELVFAGFLIRVRPDPKKLFSKYLKYFLQSDYYWNWVNVNSMRSGQPGINSSQYASLLILSPSLKEQHTIAEALSDVDELIRSLDSLIEKKSAIKKGAMQQLLTGKRRLEGFSGEWEVKKLSEVILAAPDYGINAPAIDFNSEYPTYLRITDISENGEFIQSGKKSVKALNTGNYFLRRGDIVLARTGASTGKSYHYNPEDGQLVFAGFLIRIKPDPDKIRSQFIKYFLQSEPYWNWVEKNSMRSGQPGLNSMQFSSLSIPYPSLEEQNAIAEVLSTMDNELQTLRQKREKYKQIKLGMMQELLTGKTRLV